MDNEQLTKKCYEEYFITRQNDRDDLLNNPEVLFQSLAFDVSIIKAIRLCNVNRYTATVLDVGCGTGASLLNFMKLGFIPQNLFGIDIMDERIKEGCARFPNLTLAAGDASRLKYPDNHFDIVFESTMFLQITDDELATSIGSEMIRVTGQHKYIILVDWRYGKPGNPNFNAVSRRRMTKLFQIGKKTKVIGVYKGALIPPIGRVISRYLPMSYFPIQSLAPFLAGQMATVLQKL